MLWILLSAALSLGGRGRDIRKSAKSTIFVTVQYRKNNETVTVQSPKIEMNLKVKHSIIYEGSMTKEQFASRSNWNLLESKKTIQNADLNAIIYCIMICIPASETVWIVKLSNHDSIERF